MKPFIFFIMYLSGAMAFRNIILIGMPNAGKSFLGKKLSNHLDIPLYDTDRMNPIPLHKEMKSWLPFRNEEYKIIDQLMKNRNESKVISTGGGCIDHHKTFHTLLNKEKDDVIIHILVEKDKRYIQDKVLPDDWQRLWEKRAKWYFMLSEFDYWNTREGDFLTWYHHHVE